MVHGFFNHEFFRRRSCEFSKGFLKRPKKFSASKAEARRLQVLAVGSAPLLGQNVFVSEVCVPGPCKPLKASSKIPPNSVTRMWLFFCKGILPTSFLTSGLGSIGNLPRSFFRFVDFG